MVTRTDTFLSDTASGATSDSDLSKASVVEVNGNGPVVLPEGFVLTGADMDRQGSDLVIRSNDGDSVVVKDFFAGDAVPNLLSANGTHIAGNTAVLLAGREGVEVAEVNLSQAGTEGGIQMQAIGHVENVSGTVMVTRVNGIKEALSPDTLIFPGDVIEASMDGSVGLVLADETIVSLAEEGKMVLDSFVYDPISQKGSASLSILNGNFTIAGGFLSDGKEEAVIVHTPVADIVVNEAQFGGVLADGKRLTLTMMERTDGFVGDLIVRNSAGEAILTNANQALTIGSYQDAPSGIFMVNTEQIMAAFQSTLGTLPVNYGLGNHYANRHDVPADHPANLPDSGVEVAQFEPAAGGNDGNAGTDGPVDPFAGVNPGFINVVDGSPELFQSLDQDNNFGSGFNAAPPPRNDGGSRDRPPRDRNDDSVDNAVNLTTAPNLSVENAAGIEDQAIALTIDASLVEENDTLSIAIQGVPAGATLSLGARAANGAWIIQGDDLDNLASLTMTPPANYSGTLNLRVTARASEQDDFSDTQVTLQVTVTGDADAAVFNGNGGSGAKDSWIDVSLSVAKGDASESLSDVTISGVPSGAQLSAGTDNGNGTWTLTIADLAGLQIKPAAGYQGTFTLTASVTSTDGTDTETVSTTFDVTALKPASTGNDKLTGGGANDAIDGGEGNDTVNGGSGNDTVDGGEGNDRAYGGEGADTVDGGTGNDTVDGGTGDDTVDGGEGNDRAYGGEGNDVVDGGTGNDRVYGGAGADELYGGEGNDYLYVDGDDTVIQGGDGVDRVYVQGSDGVDLNLADSEVEHAYGAGGNDALDGSGLTTNTSIYGRDGDDEITGGSGNDNVRGDAGSDTVDGGTGNDRAYGGDGADTVSGGDGADRVYGDAGDDIVDGGTGNDRVYGGAGADELYGGAGNDYLYVDGDDTVIEGGDGIDRVYGQGSGDLNINLANQSIEYAYGGAGNDTLDGSGLTSNTQIYGNDGDDTITGGSGHDTLKGDAGNDTIDGGAGNDKIYGGAGADTLIGGAGNDTLYIDADDLAAGSINAGEGSGDNIVFQGTEDVTIDIADFNAEKASGGSGNDTITAAGVTAKATLYGKDGDDTVTGGDNADSLYGDNGNDIVDGGAGADRVYGGAGNDIVRGGDGNDRLYGNAGADTLEGGAGNDTLYVDADDINYGSISGGDGRDTLIISGSDDLTINVASLDSIESVTAGSGNDTIDGSTLTDNASLVGKDGNDTITGGAGNDTIKGDNGADIVDGGAGHDKVYGGAGNDIVRGGDGNDRLYGDAGADTLEGGAGNDSLYVDADDLASGSVDGGDGIDRIYIQGTDGLEIILTDYDVEHAYGNAGDDTLDGSSLTSNTAIYGRAGNDTIKGGSGNDNLRGDAGDDLIIGGAGVDRLYAGSGNDTLDGGAGNDRLYGGDGNDTFVFDSGDGIDTVYNFLAGDVLRFEGISDSDDVTISQSGSNVVFTIGADKVTLANAPDTNTESYQVTESGDGAVVVTFNELS